MNKAKLQTGLLAVAAMAASAGVFAQANQPSANVRTALSGAQEVPAVTGTSTSGSVRLIFDAALSEIRYGLIVRSGTAVSAAHLHCGRAGINGPIVAFLYAGPTRNVDGLLALGIIENADIDPQTCGPAPGVEFPVNNVASLFQAAREGLIYANVHTDANPSGEVRGQVFP